MASTVYETEICPASIRMVLKLCEKSYITAIKLFALFCFFLPAEPLPSPVLLDNNLYEAEVGFFYLIIEVEVASGG